jgi:hypothetical protein
LIAGGVFGSVRVTRSGAYEMTGLHWRVRKALHRLLPLALGALGCVTDPDAIASVVVSPERVTFASIHAPAETVTVTVTGTNGRTRTDPVAWQYFVYYTGWMPGVSGDLRVAPVGSGNRFVFRPAAMPTVMLLRATAGGVGSDYVWVSVSAGPPTALKFDVRPPSAPVSGVPFSVTLWMADADGFQAFSEAAVTASIASGTGTLVGTTTVAQNGHWTIFSNLAVIGTGPHTLRFSSPGLTDLVSEPFTVRTPPPQ